MAKSILGLPGCFWPCFGFHSSNWAAVSLLRQQCPANLSLRTFRTLDIFSLKLFVCDMLTPVDIKSMT